MTYIYATSVEVRVAAGQLVSGRRRERDIRRVATAGHRGVERTGLTPRHGNQPSCDHLAVCFDPCGETTW